MRRVATVLSALLILVCVALGAGDQSLNTGWRFFKGDPAGAEQTGFDDSSWTSVEVPHTWNVEDGPKGKTYYRGPVWYRLHLPVSEDLTTHRLFLRFGAASLVAAVYVNGKSIGSHIGGFTAFCFDVTPAIHRGDNVLAVRVDNKLDPNVAPLSGDFTVFGGLYREVKLLVRPLLCIAPDQDATSGVSIVPTLNDSRTEGKVEVTTAVRNGGPDQTPTLEAAILNPKGRVVAQVYATVSVAGGNTFAITQELHVPSPHLWNGVKDPTLYRLRLTLRVEREVKDQVTETFGFRQFSVDPERGLLLNGAPYDLHGVDIHQGRVSCGWAASREMQDEDYRLVRELGCTGVRMAHYPHADHEYELCDQKGLVVWAEVPLVNRATDSPEFFDSTKQQLRELIHQEGNHPSIFFWSLYNEPAISKKGDQEWRLVREMNDLAHQLDPSRLTTGAVSIGANHWLDWVMDVTAINRYWGWYGKGVDKWDENLAKLRQEANGRSFGISEYGAGASVNQHEDHPVQPVAGGKWHPEEWQSNAHEQIWPALRDKPWIWCKFIWVMFDFSSVGRNEGDQAGINDKGLVTSDRKTLKDTYFYYKANWNPEPMVYITGRRYNPRPAGTVTFKVYSNCSTVELWVNGRSLGQKSSPSHVFTWDASVGKGVIRVEAAGVGAGPHPRDRVAWELN